MTPEDNALKEDLMRFEDEIAELFTSGKIFAPVHLSDGNEDALIDIFKNVKKDDWVFSTHRSHYHALLHGIDREWLKQEILKGNSITVCNPEHHFYSSGIVGGVTSIALGVALGLARSSTSEHVWLFVGDMAAEGGVFHEAVNYAARNNLPITFVVEDNGVSTNTSTKKAWGECALPPRIIRYEYKKEKFPHYGSGKWVTFG